MNESLDHEANQSPKYHQLLKTAEELFTRHGIKRVTVGEICETAGVSKMTFYKFFKNKDDLAKRVTVAIFDEGQARFNAIMSQEIPFVDKMSLFVDFKLDYGKRISTEFYFDMLGTNPEIHEFLAERSQNNLHQILEIFREAQRKGEIRKNLNLEFVAFMLDHTLELSEDPRLQVIFPSTYELVRDWLDYFFYGIMGKEGEVNA
ncbi:MAG: TetR/AcrR family transcriptional regulator [Fidelibacterota bacterium]|nr:MAG: TetR/AcrR family transcriptional regulator [Candidatus Neomarinimicrobiota bacterium]